MKRVVEPMEVRASGVDEISRVEVAVTLGYVTRGTMLESRRVSSLGSAHSHTLDHSVHRMLLSVLHRKLPLYVPETAVLA